MKSFPVVGFGKRLTEKFSAFLVEIPTGCVIVTEEVAMQLLASVTVRLYVPAQSPVIDVVVLDRGPADQAV